MRTGNMEMSVNKTRSKVSAGGINLLCLRTYGVGYIPHIGNPSMPDGHVRRIYLQSIHVYQCSSQYYGVSLFLAPGSIQNT